MTPTAVTQVHGTFAPGGADWHGGNPPVVQLVPVDRRGMNLGSSVDQSKGTFAFQQVFPGSYTLVVFSNGNEEKRVGAWQRVEVSDRPVHVVVELRQAIEISGKVEIEGGGNTTNKVTLSQLQVALVPPTQMGMPGAQ